MWAVSKLRLGTSYLSFGCCGNSTHTNKAPFPAKCVFFHQRVAPLPRLSCLGWGSLREARTGWGVGGCGFRTCSPGWLAAGQCGVPQRTAREARERLDKPGVTDPMCYAQKRHVPLSPCSLASCPWLLPWLPASAHPFLRLCFHQG